MGLDHPDHIFGTILDVYAAAGSTRTNDFIDNSRLCDHIRKLCGSSHSTPKFVTDVYVHNVYGHHWVESVHTMKTGSHQSVEGTASASKLGIYRRSYLV